jgi:hypothetical protein
MNTENEKPPPHYPNPRQALGLVLLIIPIAFAAFLACELVLELLPEPLSAPGPFRSFVEVLVYGLTLGLTIRIALRRRASSDEPRRPALKLTKVSAGILAVTCLVNTALLVILIPIMSAIPVAEWYERLVSQSIQLDLASFAGMVLLAPVLEEVLFRGIILEGLLTNQKPAAAIAWSSMLFSLAHLNPWQVLPTLAGGLFLGWVYWRTRSLIPCILIHATNNLIGFVLLARIDPAAKISDLMGPVAQAAVLAGSVIVFAAGAWWLARNMGKPTALAA